MLQCDAFIADNLYKHAMFDCIAGTDLDPNSVKHTQFDINVVFLKDLFFEEVDFEKSADDQ